MRRLVVPVLLAAALAGCLSSGPTGSLSERGLDVQAPGDATLETVENGVALVWEQVELPFEQDVQIPANATIVRAHGTMPGDERLYVHLEHAETGRRRCNTPYIASWEQATTGSMTCSGLTAVDDLPTDWTVEVQGGADVAETVRVEILTKPVEGPAAELDLDKLEPPTNGIAGTESTMVESFDGTELYVEVTTPTGDGPWPTIIASSPYNSGYHAANEPSLWEYFVKDWTQRGYAVVVADVRGTGYSDGCMEVWGRSEQADQRVLVEWTADQPFSDGHVGFYGQSYVGTTPVEAAVQAPDALDAIITVAPVIDAYRDWHFGGVPNGENVGSPVFYQSFTGGASDLEVGDPARSAIKAANGLCDPTLTARANDPRAVYDAFYVDRNFSKLADQVEAATMYTHGFEDPNVKSDMAVPFFNAIDAPKLGLFGHWTHQHPPRADTEALMLAWMAEHVKGKEMGFDRVANASIRTDADTFRGAEAWPPKHPDHRMLYPAFDDGTLAAEPSSGEASVALAPTSTPDGVPAQVVLDRELDEDLHLAGKGKLRLRATIEQGGSANLAAFLYDVGPDGTRLVTWGMRNLAHEDAHRTWVSRDPGETVVKGLPLIATDAVIPADHTLRLVIRSAHTTDWFAVDPGPPGQVTLHGGEDGVRLTLPLGQTGQATPLSVQS